MQGFQLGKNNCLVRNIFFSSWALFYAQLEFSSLLRLNLFLYDFIFCKDYLLLLLAFLPHRQWLMAKS